MKRLMIGTLVVALGIGAVGAGAVARADNYHWASATWNLAGVMASWPHYSRRAPRRVASPVVVVQQPAVVYYSTRSYRAVRSYPTLGVQSVTYYNGHRGYPHGHTVRRVEPSSPRRVYRSGFRDGHSTGYRDGYSDGRR